jgi:predicted DNA-binding transcriptional regulator AlpA
MKATVIFIALQQLDNITAVGTVTVYRFYYPEGLGRFPTSLRTFSQIRASPRFLSSRYRRLEANYSPPSSTKVKTVAL